MQDNITVNKLLILNEIRWGILLPTIMQYILNVLNFYVYSIIRKMRSGFMEGIKILIVEDDVT